MDRSSPFPLKLYLESVVDILDALNYDDQNYARPERVKTLQYVYSETAKHFSQPYQQELLKVSPKKLAAAMRTATNVTVCCWVKVAKEVMVAISIYWVYIIFLDDSNKDPSLQMSSFVPDLLGGNQQKHPFWRLVAGHLPDFLSHYGGFCSLAIIRSTLDYFQGCWIETRNFQGYEGSRYYPGFLRRLNGLGGICGGSLFPAAQYDENKLFNEITTVIAQIEPIATLVNDLFSFYKEYECPRDEISLITNYCHVEGKSFQDAFERLTADTVGCIEQLKSTFDRTKTPAVSDAMYAFAHGYMTWHMCDERYRMHEVYDQCGNSPVERKFRQYYEAAVNAGKIDIQVWPAFLATDNGVKSQVSAEATTEKLVSCYGLDTQEQGTTGSDTDVGPCCDG